MDMESPLHGGSPCTLYSAFAPFIVTCGARTKFMKFSLPQQQCNLLLFFLAEHHQCRHIPTQQLSEKNKKKKHPIPLYKFSLSIPIISTLNF